MRKYTQRNYINRHLKQIKDKKLGNRKSPSASNQIGSPARPNNPPTPLRAPPAPLAAPAALEAPGIRFKKFEKIELKEPKKLKDLKKGRFWRDLSASAAWLA